METAMKPEERNQDANIRQGSDSIARHPNILILCMDQWDTHMHIPEDVQFPAMQRLEAEGVSFDRQYCTVPICTPSRASMWTGVHAKQTGLWDNTNFAWINELASGIPTIGHMLRDQGYYTAFKGKWHCSEVPHSEDALERYGFADYQQWGEMFGGPLQGAQLDGAAAFETVDWLENKGTRPDQPWLLVCSLINPHDVMFLQTDPAEAPDPNGAIAGWQTKVQTLGWFQRKWDVALPQNFEDDLRLQPYGVRHYKENIEKHYGRIPEDRTELWLARRNYLINAMRLVDSEFQKILHALDRLDLWRNTIVIFTSDHGEMNGAHRMSQKGAIHFDEAAIVNLTVCVPDGIRGERTTAIGSHIDLAPTLLEFAGLAEEEIRERYPQIKGRSLRSAILDTKNDGPRGSSRNPGRGALYCWDGLHSLDYEWAITGGLRFVTNLSVGQQSDPEAGARAAQEAKLRHVGQTFGAPDFSKRTFFRTVVDGRYKFVRWFSPEEYGNPSTLDDLNAKSDITLHDLKEDPGEIENLGNPQHPEYRPALVEHMLQKLHALVQHEIGSDESPFSLDLFGTRKVKSTKRKKVEEDRRAA
jgi:arylsulfatase A-like enzyme